jgi:hypothetical protein
VRIDHGDRPAVGRGSWGTGPTDAPAAFGAADRVGALVVHTPVRLHRSAIEIHAAGAPWTGTTALVRERRVADCLSHEAVFPRLEVGLYELRMLGAASGVVVPVAITEGAVVETWLDAPVD